MSVWTYITERIRQTTGTPFSPTAPVTAGGGCINRTYHLSDNSQSYLVKLNNITLLSMFEAEADGLREIINSHSIHAPKPICYGYCENSSYLVLEYIQMSGAGDMQQAGRLLALMHRQVGERFGWSRDNTIGSTHQPNTLSDNWAEFWQRHRLGYQLKLAHELGHGCRLQESGNRLLQLLPQLIGHNPQPSLLHGDLWSGNIAFDSEHQPVIFDPAVYYGDRETDLAMTELFGGFSTGFYAAYNEVWPLDPGYTGRRNLYNLYHVLNHLNIFGGGYASQAQGLIDRLLSDMDH